MSTSSAVRISMMFCIAVMVAVMIGGLIYISRLGDSELIQGAPWLVFLAVIFGAILTGMIYMAAIKKNWHILYYHH